jgi:thioredoxin-related protein
MQRTVFLERAFYFLVFVFFNPVPSTMAQDKLSVNWLSFEQLSDSLSRFPKPTFIFFETDWCVYCKKMEKQVFTNPELINLLNKEYYAVRLDAESTDTIYFDGRQFSNLVGKKRRGQYHELAKLLGKRGDEFSAPVLLVLDENFYVKERYFEYLDSKRLLRILRNAYSFR